MNTKSNPGCLAFMQLAACNTSKVVKKETHTFAFIPYPTHLTIQ